jgi:AcrR family transcriptional regulator
MAAGEFAISHDYAKVLGMDAKTQKSELTRAAIVGAAMDLALAEGLEAITLQAVASRLALSKSGVFSRVGSREALQKAVIEEFGRRFLADVFVPAMQQPKGLPRLNEIVRRWIIRTRDVEAQQGCIFTAGAFELDDKDGALRDHLLGEVTRWRAALRRTVLQAMEAGHLKPDTDPEQLVGEIYSLAMGLLHDVRFLRDPRAPERAQATWVRLLTTYRS